MHRFEYQRFLDQSRFLIGSVVLPDSHIREMLIIPQRLSFRSLVLSAEVPSARFVAVQTVPGHQLAQFEEIGQTERLFELLVEILDD